MIRRRLLLSHPARLGLVWKANSADLVLPARSYFGGTTVSKLPRAFSTTTSSRLRDFFPQTETKLIRKTPSAWPHKGWTDEQMLSVQVGHREPNNVGDWIAWRLIRLARWFMDKATGLSTNQQVDKKNPTTAVLAEKPLTEAQWLVRFVFLESIAGGSSFPLRAYQQLTD